MAKKRIIALTTVLFLMIAMVSATYAWFINYQVNKASGYDITINGGDILQVSIDNSNFYNTLDLNTLLLDDDGKSILEGLDMIDVTGDGVTFRRPVLIQEGMIATPDTSEEAVWTDAANGYDYLSFKLYFRANKQMSVFLGNQSYAAPKSPVIVWEDYYSDEAGTYKYDTESGKYVVAEGSYAGERFSKTVIEESWNRSGFGNFSKDCIVGASRVSFVDYTNQTQPLKFIWIPNTTYVLNDQIWTVETKDVAFDTKHLYYDENKESAEITDVLYNLTISPDSTYNANDPSLILDLSSFDGEYYRGEITVNIWVEGCDNESRRALSGGRFKIDMQFVGLEQQ